MKIRIPIAALLLIVAAACSRFQTTEEENAAEKAKHVAVTVRIDGAAATRVSAADVGNDAAVSDIQLFVFNEKSEIESYAKGSESTFTVNVTTGRKYFIALANCPDLGKEIDTRDALLATVSRLQDNSPAALQMVGETTVSEVKANQAVSITVKRLVSKVVIQNVKTDFSSPYLAGLEFKITGIYLINVVASNNYAMSQKREEYEWVNKLRLDSGNPAAALTQDTGLNITVTKADPYTTAHTFYAYPNPVMENYTSGEWSLRKTRLVVETTLGGTLGYYSLELPILERNKIYTITDLTVTKRGTVNPYEPVVTTDAKFTITVVDWETGTSSSVII